MTLCVAEGKKVGLCLFEGRRLLTGTQPTPQLTFPPIVTIVSHPLAPRQVSSDTVLDFKLRNRLEARSQQPRSQQPL